MRYWLSDILFLFAYYVVRYRRSVTRNNLSRAYPELGESRRKELEKAYYRHMCDLLIEGIHNLYQQWFSVKALDIYTAIVQKDGRYFAIGTVTHRGLAKEAALTRKKPGITPSF